MKHRKAALLALSPPQAGHGSNPDGLQGKATQYGGEMAGQTAFNGCEYRFSEIRRPRKWVQMGQQIHKYKNLLNRNFQADRPNSKWATDISYIHAGQSAVSLSMIHYLYDSSIAAYKIASAQTVDLLLDTVRLAMKQEKKKVAAEL